MRPYVVGSACHRVQQQLDTSLSSGMLELPAELVAHAERCPHCSPQVREVEALFQRLRGVPATIDLGPVPGVVDEVLKHIAREPQSRPVAQLSNAATAKRKAHLRWVLGQVATVAAVLCIAVTGLTYITLKVNQAVSGVKPGEVVEKWVEPLQNWTQALFGKTE